MDYHITFLIAPEHPEFKISKNEFEQIKNANKCLSNLLRLEHNFNLIVENYIDYERDTLTDITEYMVRGKGIDYNDFQSIITNSTKNILNILNACRLYFDQTPHLLNTIFGKDNPIISNFIQLKSSHYDNCLSFRVMEALRNFIQHRGIPIGFIRLSEKVIESQNKNAFSLTSFLQIKEIEFDEKFKRSVYFELAKISDDKIDLKPLMKKYITHIGQLQNSVRESISEQTTEWEDNIREVLEKYFPKNLEKTQEYHLHALLTCHTPSGSEQLIIFPELQAYRQLLEKQNKQLNQLENRFVISDETLLKT
jgi:hypothetical protein